MKSITPTLMFTGTAEKAIALYLSVFPNSKILHMKKYGSESPEMEGQIVQAAIRICGQEMLFQDSAPVHDFTFTPSVSFTINLDSEAEFQKVYDVLSEGGQALMPPDNYGFSSKFAWINDPFGVSWQLNLA